MISRKERLTLELRAAETVLDELGRTLDHGLMRSQQTIAGARARVLGLRVELLQIEINNVVGKGEDALARRAELRADRCDLSLRIKEAELAARAASKQATEDELPMLLEKLRTATAMAEEVDALH